MSRWYNNTLCTCVDGGTLAFKASNLEVIGGTAFDVPQNVDLILNASGYDLSSKITFNEKASLFLPESLKATDLDIPIIDIQWTDGSAPKVPRKFWTTLVDELREKRKPLRIFCCCVGGHGRTGTMLAVLAGLLLTVKDPVAYIRKHYCRRAVESELQARYVEFVTGKEVKNFKPIETVYDYAQWKGVK